jgi:hypothetical protein
VPLNTRQSSTTFYRCLLKNNLIAIVAAIVRTTVSTMAMPGSDALIGDRAAKADVAVSETNVVAMKILNIWSVPFSFRGKLPSNPKRPLRRSKSFK